MKYPVYVVSLQRDELRRENLQKIFKNYDKFEIVDAVDGRILNAKDYYDAVLPSIAANYKTPQILSPSELGCTLSHIKVYEKFLSGSAPYALVLEDDVIGNDEGIFKAFDMLKNISENSILICGAQDGLDSRFSAFGRRICDDLFLVPIYSYRYIFRTTAYIITRKSAENLLNFYKNINYTLADAWDITLSHQNIKMYFADIFSHPDDISNSGIQTERDTKSTVYKMLSRPKWRRAITRLRCLFYRYFDKNEMIFRS
ncbi:glycosyltransferase family 25 protein [Campylobacter sp. faydin G-140]|uniref:glycosyltransferase family 25 protein n=1 Tax=Campylobacter anatolicus TaxID=2829105 RepID=UPI001B932DD3|nr:glycosyltransferase family 25 protein [Campylobacter anatolicus]MBR8465227.1 glycosyltransferase family 25 protein [Campylobacter anatolicus]